MSDLCGVAIRRDDDGTILHCNKAAGHGGYHYHSRLERPAKETAGPSVPRTLDDETLWGEP